MSPPLELASQDAAGARHVVLLFVLVALAAAGCTCEAECFPYCSDDAGVSADAR